MEKKNPKISVIVPVYNVEQYLCRCIDSILAQSFPDFELLLIDDGSKDHSGEICDEYAQKDERVRVFHKENGGVSSARNLGLDNAKGEWISFVDADDWVEEDYLKNLQNTDEKEIDLVECGYYNVSKNGEIEVLPTFKDKDAKLYLKKLFSYAPFYEGYLWVKLFKRSIIGKENLRFDINLHYNEDRVFIAKYLNFCKNIKTLPRCLYHYNNLQCNAMAKLGNVIDERTITELDSYCILLNNPRFDISVKNSIAGIGQNMLCRFYIISHDNNERKRLLAYYQQYRIYSTPNLLLKVYRYNYILGSIYNFILRCKRKMKKIINC